MDNQDSNNNKMDNNNQGPDGDDRKITVMVDGLDWKGSMDKGGGEPTETMYTLHSHPPHGEQQQEAEYEEVEGGVEIVPQNQQFHSTCTKEATIEPTVEATIEQPPTRNNGCHHPRIQELYQSADWWTLWIGLASYGLANAIVFAVVPFLRNDNTDMLKYVVPQPLPWETNPLEAWTVYQLVGVPVLLVVLFVMYAVSLWAMGKCELTCSNNNTNNKTLSSVLAGFAAVSVLATLSMWLGANQWCKANGLGYAVFAIGIGMLVTNVLPQAWTQSLRTSLAAKHGEFFIKCSLVLLAVELDVLVRVGAPAMVVAWVGSPITIVLGYLIGTRCCCHRKPTSMDADTAKENTTTNQDSTDDDNKQPQQEVVVDHRPLVMLIAVGASWCGASAISAVAPAVGARPHDVALALSVVACFTVVFTFVQPYLALAVGMPEAVAGAWIGGSVDQTGNVLVAAAIVSEQATEVAGIVKMVLNSGLGVMASVIAVWWSYGNDDSSAKGFRWIQLWDKFPKFTLGFLITSAILTGTLQALGDDYPQAIVALPRAVATLNKWWFAIAFVGIGLSTNVRKLAKEAWKTGVLQIYLVTNTIDILLALGLAYAVY